MVPEKVIDPSASAPSDPPAPKDDRFAVPEASTLLLVGGALVWLAFAKRRIRIRGATVAVPR